MQAGIDAWSPLQQEVRLSDTHPRVGFSEVQNRFAVKDSRGIFDEKAVPADHIQTF